MPIFIMAEKEDRLDIAIGTVLTAVVTLIMICYFAIPVVQGAIDSLTGSATSYGPMIGLALTMMIFATVILIVRGFNRSR